MFGQLLDPAGKTSDPLTCSSSPDLQFGLSRPATTDSTGEPAQAIIDLAQTRETVFELRQLHLQLPVSRLCSLGENVEDQLGPIDDLEIREVRDRPSLVRPQLLVEDQQLGVLTQGLDHHVLKLATTHEIAGIGLLSQLKDTPNCRDTGRIGEPCELIERVLSLVRHAFRRHVNQNRAPLGGRDGASLLGSRVLTLEGSDELEKVDSELVERDRPLDPPDIAASRLGQEVRIVHVTSVALRADTDRRDEVKAKPHEVDQVVSRQRLVVKMGVEESQPAEPALGGTKAAEVGDVNLRRRAHRDVIDVATARDEEPNLSTDISRDRRQGRGQLDGDDPRWWDSSAGKSLEGLELRRFETVEVP